MVHAIVDLHVFHQNKPYDVMRTVNPMRILVFGYTALRLSIWQNWNLETHRILKAQGNMKKKLMDFTKLQYFD